MLFLLEHLVALRFESRQKNKTFLSRRGGEDSDGSSSPGQTTLNQENIKQTNQGKQIKEANEYVLRSNKQIKVSLVGSKK